MPTLRLERLAIRTLVLGLLGFDHLQLVYDPWSIGPHLQDHWHVLEGIRDPSPEGPRLGAQGTDGTLTLARANTARGTDLEARIGPAHQRRSLVLAQGPRAVALWPRLTAHASAIAAEPWPYIAYAAPGSPLPTVNSNSLIASVLHDAGVDTAANLPPGASYMPGLETLLGTAASETLTATAQLTTLLGGSGDDRLVGGEDALRPSKLYGGAGDDVCLWSPAVAVCHGGQPRLAHGGDGADTLRFRDAAQAIVGAATSGHADVGAGLTLSVGALRTRIYSVETLRWSDRSDRVTLVPSALAASAPLLLDLSGEAPHGPGDILDLSRLAGGVSAISHAGDLIIAPAKSAAATKVTARSVETLMATPDDDHVRLSPGMRRFDAGHGDDFIVASPDVSTLHIDVGSGADTLLLDLQARVRSAQAVVHVRGGGFDDRIVLSPELAPCADATPSLASHHVTYDRRGARLTLVFAEKPGAAATMTVHLHNFVDGHWGIYPARQRHGGPAEQAAMACHRHRHALGNLAQMLSNHIGRIRMTEGKADVSRCESAMARVPDGDPACRDPRAVGRTAIPAPSRRALHFADWRRTRRRKHRGCGNDRARRRHAGPPGGPARPPPTRIRRCAHKLAAAAGRTRRSEQSGGRAHR